LLTNSSSCFCFFLYVLHLSLDLSFCVCAEVFENRQCNKLFWSPLGTHLVLAGLGPMNGQLEWVDCDAGEPTGPPQEHFQCADVEWDPSGRYVITSATQPLGAEAWRYTVSDTF
jgi:translation initiation factor 3 subunit B